MESTNACAKKLEITAQHGLESSTRFSLLCGLIWVTMPPTGVGIGRLLLRLAMLLNKLKQKNRQTSILNITKAKNKLRTIKLREMHVEK